ncbi:MAG TPA: DUF1761 domain-containing protein [Acidimicrobiia bacterium]|jgi:hypothetical protein|nr:DUF1761 domain-containing protein [Acidimicrobiia bacterium]
MPPVNIWAVLLATLSTMIVGSIWYTPKVFGNRWMQLTGVEPGETSSAVGPIIITVIVSFVTAYALAILTTMAHEFNGGSYLGNALLIGVIGWAGFTAARFITHDAFEGRPTALTTLNIGNELVTVLVMALIIGAFGSPA